MAASPPATCACGHSFSAHTLGRAKGCSFCSCQRFDDAVLDEISEKAQAAVELLAANPALKHVPRQLIALAEGGQRRLYLEGKVLMAQDAPNHSLHILVKGRVRVDRILHGHNKLLARLAPGDLIGDLGVLNETPRLATVTAIDDVETLELSADLLKRVFKQHSGLLLAMMRVVNERIYGKS